MTEFKKISRRHLIDRCVTDEDVEDAIQLLKNAVLAQDLSAAKTLIDLTIGSKKDHDAMILACQRNTLDMLKYLIEKGISNGMENEEIIQLIKNFEIDKFIPSNFINQRQNMKEHLQDFNNIEDLDNINLINLNNSETMPLQYQKTAKNRVTPTNKNELTLSPNIKSTTSTQNTHANKSNDKEIDNVVIFGEDEDSWDKSY